MGPVMLALPIAVVVFLLARERALYRDHYRKGIDR